MLISMEYHTLEIKYFLGTCYLLGYVYVLPTSTLAEKPAARRLHGRVEAAGPGDFATSVAAAVPKYVLHMWAVMGARQEDGAGTNRRRSLARPCHRRPLPLLPRVVVATVRYGGMVWKYVCMDAYVPTWLPM